MNLSEKPSEAPRLRHIAELTGLSLGTISKVLNGKSGVSDENRTKVKNAVDTLGFRRWPRLTESQSALSSITLIAYSQAASGNIFYEKIIRSLIETGQQRGISIDINLIMLPQHSATDISESHLFKNGKPQAAILLGIDHPSVLDKIIAEGCPALLVNGIDPLMRFDSICPDYYLGGYLATKRLLDLGHRDIVHVGTARRMTLDLRRQGFITALNDVGIVFDPTRHFIDIGWQDFSTLDEPHFTHQVITEGKPKGSAFFAVADTVAINIIHVLNHHGFSVPGDVSVIGFDDLAVSARCVPPLTTLHSRRTVMGQMAIQMLIDRADQPEKEIDRVSIGVDLVQRESTA